jgi:thymidylate kinase
MRRLLIYFIGIDGSGKSSLSQHVRNELLSKGFNTSYTWWLESESSIFRSFLRKLAGDSKLGALQRAAHPMGHFTPKPLGFKSRVLNTLYPIVVLLDYLRFGLIKTWPVRFSKGTIINIFDRYYPDAVLALSKEFRWSDTRRNRWMRLFRFFLPNPNLTIMIDVAPEVAFKRKMDEILLLENSVKARDEYLSLCTYLHDFASFNILTINNEGPPAVAQNIVLKTITELITKAGIKCRAI